MISYAIEIGKKIQGKIEATVGGWTKSEGGDHEVQEDGKMARERASVLERGVPFGLSKGKQSR